MNEDGTLNGKITYADMADALERWLVNGNIGRRKYEELRDALATAFQVGCAEYLARRTEIVCGRAK
ncbi:MAG: hypothetical protein IKL01_08360 [Mailhella sp.]|nr:hypothetical protein [Mailhella sp.]